MYDFVGMRFSSKFHSSHMVVLHRGSGSHVESQMNNVSYKS